MVIRTATIEDADALASIMAAVAPEGVLGTEAPVDVPERTARFRELIEKAGNGATWIVEDEGEPVGNAGTYEVTPGVFGLGMALLPTARGRGIGRELMETIIAHARAAGAHKVELEVWPDNGRAIALYVAAGFEVEGLRRDHYRRRDGSLRSALIMARLL